MDSAKRNKAMESAFIVRVLVPARKRAHAPTGCAMRDYGNYSTDKRQHTRAKVLTGWHCAEPRADRSAVLAALFGRQDGQAYPAA